MNIGIDFVKRHKQYISKDSPNLIDEKKAYKYKEDSNGVVSESPVIWQDHAMDAERMAIYSHLLKMGVKKGGVYFKHLHNQPTKEYLYKEREEKKEDEEEDKLLLENKAKENKGIILTPRTNKLVRKGGVFYHGK